MRLDPEEVVRAAFEAFAAGEAGTLASLSDPEAIEQRRAMLAVELAAAQQSPHHPSYAEVLSSFGVRSLAELQELGQAELLNGELRALPSRRTMLQCDTVGQVAEGPGIRHVLFRIRWKDFDQVEPDINVATLREIDGEWRLLLDPLSSWVMPGFRNLLIADL